MRSLHRPVTTQAAPRKTREEGAIATPIDRSIDQAFRKHKNRSRMVSAAILGLGLLVAAAILLSGGRQRERAANRIKVGDDSAAVRVLLGAPGARCPAGTLVHLSDRFPGGTPRTTIESTVYQLSRETSARWVYADDDAAECRPEKGDIEVGFDQAGKVLWYVPVHGRKTLVLPGGR